MRKMHNSAGFVLAAASAAGIAALTACGGGVDPTGASFTARQQETFEGPVPRASCGPDDPVETGLQGQVPLEDQASGRTLSQPYACNLERVSQFQGEGASWQLAWFDDCAYYTTATLVQLPQHPALAGHPKPGQMFPGVNILDMADPTAPERTANLTTTAMLDPWESLKVNEPRELLGAINAAGGNGGPELDLYDISGDCRQPELLFSGAVGGNEQPSHGGNFTPDGQFYYGADFFNEVLYPMEISDPENPTLVGLFNFATHDISIREDGNRAYLANQSGNGLTIIDTSDVQDRVPEPSITVVGEVFWDDGATAQMTLPITIGDNPNYILFVDEGGAGAARLIDISDEENPFIVSKLKLEVHMPENSNAVAPDTASGPVFGYNGHYCTPDDPDDTQIIVCGYFMSGLRVFDVRDPYAPREIAYYNPPATPGYHPGSNFQLEGTCTTQDWASAHSRIVMEREEIWMLTQCGGIHVVRFTRPLSELLGED